MKADPQTITEVLAVLAQMSHAYQQRNLNQILSLHVPDADVFMFGAAANEKRVGRTQIQAQIEQDWFQADDSTFTIGWHTISATGTVAWVAADAEFNVLAGDIEMLIPARLTAVLEKRNDQWLIAQSHFSTPL